MKVILFKVGTFPSKVGDIEWIKKNFDLEKFQTSLMKLQLSIYPQTIFMRFFKILRELSVPPIIAGGKVSDFEVVEKYFLSGCDKILLNSSLHEKPKLVKKFNSYGAQSIVASIDVKKDKNEYSVYLNNGKKNYINSKSYIKDILKMDIGEIFVKTIDKDKVNWFRL